MKTCSKCKQTKPLSEFYKLKRSKDGLQSQCKECSYCKNKDRIKQYYQENKDRIKQYYQENKENKINYRRDYYKKNKDKILSQKEEYRKNNKDKINVLMNRRRELEKELDSNYTIEDMNYTFALFENKCYNCGSEDDLQIDHHYSLSKGYGLSRDNAVVLCKSCNCSKHNKLPEEFYTEDQLVDLSELLCYNEIN